MGPRRSNAIRKDEYMETATPVSEHAPDTDVTLRTNGSGKRFAIVPRLAKIKLAMDRFFRNMAKPQTVGPLTVFLIVVIYSLLSPHLPAPIHDYIYHILH